ncbi:MAG: TspO/MBR family protein [Pseudomonadota bacterium]
MKRWATFAIFLIATMSLGGVIGASTPPGEWYDNLSKPVFNPPDWVFAPVWTVLYAMVAFAGWRSWDRAAISPSTRLWFIQFVINLTWSPVFFGLQMMGFALIIIIFMIALTVAFIASSWKTDQIAALFMVPYLAWISFAALLNATLWAMN